MPITQFEDEAFDDLVQWFKENPKIANKIYKLIYDIKRNGLGKGIGKPERLKHIDGWSRRIDDMNRLVYGVKDGHLHILSCRGHYED